MFYNCVSTYTMFHALYRSIYLVLCLRSVVGSLTTHARKLNFDRFAIRYKGGSAVLLLRAPVYSECQTVDQVVRLY